MTDEQTRDYIIGLLREKQGYEAKGDADGVRAVEAELARVGHEAAPPAKRAVKRVTAKGATR